MPAATSLTIEDREDTPVEHTFEPKYIEPGKAVFTEPGSVPMGDRKITMSWRESNDGSKIYRRVTFYLPVVVTETINGVSRPTVERNAYVDLNFRFDSSSTEQERENAVGLVASLLADGNVITDGAIVGLEGIW